MQHDIFIETFLSRLVKFSLSRTETIHHRTIKLTLKHQTDNFAVKPRLGKIS